MKKILSAFVLSAMISSAANAQVQAVTNNIGEKNEINTKSAGKSMLSDEQRRSIEEIDNYYNKLNATLTESAGYSPDAIREKKKSLEMERMEKLKQVLKPEQFNQFMAAGKITSIDPNILNKEVGLSDEQSQRLSELNASLAEKESMIQRDNEMSASDKQKALSFIQAERLENLERILTPDQMKKIANLSPTNVSAPSAAPVKKAATVAPAKKPAATPKSAKKG